MAIVTGTMENGKLTAALHGRIDSGNAAQAEAELSELRAAYPGCTTVIDCDDLEYISSAGLRMILRLRKADPDASVINAGSEIYDILEITGFTEMLPVSKAYRRLSVEGCEVIGSGSNGMVYRIDPETIVKVYRNPDSLADIKHEREVARRALILGIPTAIPYDVVRVGNSYGSVFELLNATSFSKLISSDPEHLDHYIGLYVDLLKKIHAAETDDPELPDQRLTAIGWVRWLEPHLPRDQYEKLLSLVEAVPASRHMIHGDYHTKNLMMQDDEVLLIDMDTMAVGNPVFEFSSIWLAFVGFGSLDRSAVESFIGVSIAQADRIWAETLRLYFGTDDAEFLKRKELQCRVVAYARLLRRTIKRTPDNTALIAHCREQLARLLPEMDSIAY